MALFRGGTFGCHPDFSLSTWVFPDNLENLSKIVGALPYALTMNIENTKAAGRAGVVFDASQRQVLDLAAPCTASVIGAPGTGKTRVLQEKVAMLVAADPAVKIAVLSPDRRAAAALRNEISVMLGYLPASVAVQSVSAFAFSVVSAFAQYTKRREPELISGPDQDAHIKLIFDNALEGGSPELAAALRAAGHDEETVNLQAFRAEFRDLITRAAELRLTPEQLDRLGEEYGEPDWRVGAIVMRQYENDLATAAAVESSRPDLVDHARLISLAAAQLANWDAADPKGQGRLDMRKPTWDWVFVDDLQNTTLGVLELLRQVKADGASIVTFGDPDAAVQGFRGGVAYLPAMLTRPVSAGGLGADRLYLSTRYRGEGPLGELALKATGGIHTAGAGQHRAAAFAQGTEAERASVEMNMFRNEYEEVAFAAAQMRRLHLLDGVPYAEMAVLTRSSGSHDMVRSGLIRYGVPVAPLPNSEPLRRQRAVAALIELIEVALERPERVKNSRIQALLTGPLFAMDPLKLRRLLLQARGWELAQGGMRQGEEILGEILNGGPVIDQIPELAEVAELIEKIRAAERRRALGEEVLWVAWEGLGVSESWRERALGQGLYADAASRDLDAVMALFRVAQRQADRNPGNAFIQTLITELETRDLPEDSIAQTGVRDEVSLLTPSSSIGRAWDHVFVLEVNEGVWPNTRLRNPITHVPKLVNVVVGQMIAGNEFAPNQLAREVIDDELRMFLQAVTRARKHLAISCSNGDGGQPSRFLRWINGTELENKAVPVPLDPSGLAGRLRRAVNGQDPRLQSVASQELETLAQADLVKPQQWADHFGLSTVERVVDGQPTVSPSRIESTLICPMRAFLRSNGVVSTTNTLALDIGNFVHGLAQRYPQGPGSEIVEEGLAQIGTLWLGVGYERAQNEARVRAMISNLAQYIDGAEAPLGIEQVASAELNGIKVRARLDRIEPSLGGARVVDFKTGSTALTKAAAQTNPQLMIYQWLIGQGAVRGAADPRGAWLVYLGKNAKSYTVVEQHKADEEMLDLAAGAIEASAAVSEGPDFAAVQQDQCRFCEYAAVCPALDNGRIFS